MSKEDKKRSGAQKEPNGGENDNPRDDTMYMSMFHHAQIQVHPTLGFYLQMANSSTFIMTENNIR